MTHNGGKTLGAFLPLVALLASMQPVSAASAVAVPADTVAVDPASAGSEEQHIRKVLFIGDSMTGWMAERLNAYGVKDGFEVATVVWDGSTIRKWGASSALAGMISEQHPDVVLISLGMNELFERNPASALGSRLDSIIAALGSTPYLWIGPPSWPGHAEGEKLVEWLSDTLGPGRFFNSFSLSIPRQSKNNPHPTREGIIKWIDNLVEWIPENTDLKFPRLTPPEPDAMSRGKVFIYRRMKERL